MLRNLSSDEVLQPFTFGQRISSLSPPRPRTNFVLFDGKDICGIGAVEHGDPPGHGPNVLSALAAASAPYATAASCRSTPSCPHFWASPRASFPLLFVISSAPCSSSNPTSAS